MLIAIAAGLYRLALRGLRRLEGPTAKLRRRAATGLATLSQVVTPRRALLGAAIGCAVLLGLSQFADYRGVSIGTEGYSPEISSVAPAPEVERSELGSAHSYLMLPAALIAIGVLLVAARSGRWQLCRLAALIGAIAIVVSLLIDRPAGLDEGTLVRDFTGVQARLLGGFWVQLVAGAGLIVSSLLLGAELRRTRSDRAPARRRPRRTRQGSAARPGAGSGGPGAEGAGA